MSTTKQACVVGGVTLPRPFKVRRLGHFGINVHDPEVSRHFYEKLLGFRISDVLDFGGRLPEEEMAKHGPHVGYFARHGTEHPVGKITHRLAGRWGVSIGIRPELAQRVLVLEQNLGGIAPFPLTEMQLAQIGLDAQRQTTGGSQLFGKALAALQGRTDHHVPAAEIGHGLLHLGLSEFGQGIIEATAKAAAAGGFTVAQ